MSLPLLGRRLFLSLVIAVLPYTQFSYGLTLSNLSLSRCLARLSFSCSSFVVVNLDCGCEDSGCSKYTKLCTYTRLSLVTEFKRDDPGYKLSVFDLRLQPYSIPIQDVVDIIGIGLLYGYYTL